MNNSEKLRILLEAARSVNVGELVSRIRWEDPGTSVKIPRNSAIETYSSRADLNQHKAFPIAGFESLLNNLRASSSENVFIQQMYDFAGGRFIFFTNSTVEELYGVLMLPAQAPPALDE